MGRLKHSWKFAKVLQKLEPPRRVLPLSPLIALALAGCCLRFSLQREAAALLVGFDAMLRSGELCRLRVGDVSFYCERAVLFFWGIPKQVNAAMLLTW